MLRILTPATGLLLAAALLAGCGGSNNNGSGGSTNASSGGSSTSSSNRSSNSLRMAQCMRAHGVPNFPDQPANGGPTAIQGGGPNGTATINGVTVPASTLQAAFHKCQNLLPQGPPLSSAQIAQIRQGALRMAQCMRSHGVPDFPDPQVTAAPSGHGIEMRIGVAHNSGQGGNSAQKANLTQSPAFRSAQRICMPVAREAVQRALGGSKP